MQNDDALLWSTPLSATAAPSSQLLIDTHGFCSAGESLAVRVDERMCLLWVVAGWTGSECSKPKTEENKCKSAARWRQRKWCKGLALPVNHFKTAEHTGRKTLQLTYNSSLLLQQKCSLYEQCDVVPNFKETSVCYRSQVSVQEWPTDKNESVILIIMQLNYLNKYSQCSLQGHAHYRCHNTRTVYFDTRSMYNFAIFYINTIL